MSLAEKQNQITAQLSAFKNGQERLMFLVEKARVHPALPPEFRLEQNRVPGCLAKLWLAGECRGGRCFFDCDSDSLIVKAVAGMLCDFYSDQSPEEILAVEPDFLIPFGITQHLTPNRRNALARVREDIRKFAQAALAPGREGEPSSAKTISAASPGP